MNWGRLPRTDIVRFFTVFLIGWLPLVLMQKSLACLDEHWDVSLESSKGRVLLQQKKELSPGEEDEKGSQVPRSVTVDQTETRRKSYVLVGLACKPDWNK